MRFLAALLLAALPLLAASAFSAPATQALHTISYLPLVSRPLYYRIAFVSLRDGNAEIYVMNADGSSQIKLVISDALVWSSTIN
jgi:hypothetical protein